MTTAPRTAVKLPGPPESLQIDSLILSCRALARGVEETVLHSIAESARARGAKCLRAAWIAGPRNAPAIAFLRENGFADAEDGYLSASMDLTAELPFHVVLEHDSIHAAVSSAAGVG